jgi:tRNA(fMet)-specific endonuclease VapC
METAKVFWSGRSQAVRLPRAFRVVRYLLDANAVIALLKDTTFPIARRIRRYAPPDIGIVSVVIHELYYGAFKSQRVEKNVARVDALQFPVLEFDQEDARLAGEVRAHLASKGTPIGPYDALIAGQAKARTLTLHHAQHHGVPTRTGPEGRGLEESDVVSTRGVQASEVAGQASLRITGERLRRTSYQDDRNAVCIRPKGWGVEPDRNRTALGDDVVYSERPESAGPVPRPVGRGIGVQAALTAAIVGQLRSGHGRTWRQPFMNGANRSKSPSLVTRVIPASRQEAASSASLRSDGLS